MYCLLNKKQNHVFVWPIYTRIIHWLIASTFILSLIFSLYENLLNLHVAVGIIFGLMAAFCFAIYNALSEKAMKGVSPVKLITYCMVFLVSFFGFFFGRRPYPDIVEVWMIASLLGICAGFLPFLLYIYGVQRIGAGKAVIVSSLAPVFTLLWTYTFLGERLDIVQIIGMGMIIFGVMILRLKAPVRLMIGTGEEIKSKLEGLTDEVSPDRRLFAFIYSTGLRKKR